MGPSNLIEKAGQMLVDLVKGPPKLGKDGLPLRGRGANGGTTRLPAGHQWVRHQGQRERLRRLRQGWNRFERLCQKNQEAARERERLLDAVADSPQAEVLAMCAWLEAEERVPNLRKALDAYDARPKTLVEAAARKLGLAKAPEPKPELTPETNPDGCLGPDPKVAE